MHKNFDQEPYELDEVKRDAAGGIVRGPDGIPLLETVEYSRAARLLGDRTFTIGGHEFRYRIALAPEATDRYARMVSGEDRPTVAESREVYDETVRAFLESGQEADWERVRAVDAEHPVTLNDLRGLVAWLFEQMSGRPTEPPSGSSPGSDGGATGTTSTDESSSPAEAA